MLEFPPFRLDTVNQCLWRRRGGDSDERVPLPPKGFAVLRYLGEHPGRLVTEDELLKVVWPKAYVQPEAVKSQLYLIRKVLGDDPKTPRYIETLPRLGYQFIAPVHLGPLVDPLAAARPMHRRLVGRERALAVLRDGIRRASTGQRQVVFVTGEPGIGKTALVDEFQRRAPIGLRGLRVARGQCIEAFGGTEAYYPILQALGQLCASSEGTPIVEILAAEAPTWLVQFPALVTQQHRELLRQELLGATRERMVREIGAALEMVTADTPLLLVLEDVQWVDRSTVDLISALARRRGTAQLMLIATSRSVDTLPSDHPLEALRQDLLLRQLCHEIELEPLAETDIADYLAADSSEASPPEGLAEFIQRHTEGNPLFMVAALDHLTQRGFISRENGSWQVRVPLEEIDIGIPDSLRQMIEAQIERLSKEEQRALEAASVQGAAFSVTLSAAAIDDGNAEDLETLYETLARRRRLIRSAGVQQSPDGNTSARYEFMHALYREVLYRRQPSLRRSKLHRRIGERLEVLYSQSASDVGAELAHHFEASADWPRTVKYLRLAADAAERRYGHRVAEALLEHALELTTKLPEAERVTNEINILEALAALYGVTYDPRAVPTYETLAARAADNGLNNVEVAALISMGELLLWTNPRRGVDIVDRALRLSDRQLDPLARARSRMKCSYLRLWAGTWRDEDAATCRAALSELRQADNSAAVAPYLIDYSNLLYMSSEYRESLRVAHEALAILTSGKNGNPCASMPQAVGAYIVYSDLLFLGEWGAAIREMDSAVAALTKNANDGFARAMCLWRAWLNVFAMDFAGGLKMCESVAQTFSDATPTSNRRFYMALAGTAEGALGQHDRARARLLLSREEMDRQPVTNDWLCRVLLESALTELYLSSGDLAQARAQSDRYVQVTLAGAERTWQALAWEANTRVAMADGDLKRAQELIDKALSTVGEFELPLAHWRAHATAAVLDELKGRAESAERHQHLSRATILKIADSLAPEEPLRKTFLSTASVASIMGANASG